MFYSEKQDLVEEALGERAGERVRAPCPLCIFLYGSRDKHGALSINTTTGWWRCFRCGACGRLRGYGDDDVGDEEEPESTPALDLPPEFLPLESGSLVLRRALRYALETRRVAPDAISTVGIGCALTGYWRNRLIVPIRDIDGKLITYVGRAMSDEGTQRKYQYAQAPRGSTLFNEAALLEDTQRPALIVEGTLDAVVDGVWPNAVAVLGKPTKRQLVSLATSHRPLVVVLDGDAWAEGWALARRLRLMGVPAGSVRLPPKKDPDDVPAVDLWAAANRSLHFGEAEIVEGDD